MARKYGKRFSSKKMKMVPRKPNSRANKQVKRLIKYELNKVVETKHSYKTYSTSTYNANDDMLVVANDIFGGITQGTGDSSTPGAGNRIGDAINARGVLLNFRLVARPTFNVSGTGTFQLPWVTVRLMVIQATASNALVGNPTKAKCFDDQAMTVNLAPTVVPWSMTQYGYVKKVLYDKTYKIRNDGLFVNNSVLTDPVLGNELNFKKYFKMDKIIKYTDNVTSTPNQTAFPLYFCLLAESAPFLSTGISNSPLVSISGYTKVFYKDA